MDRTAFHSTCAPLGSLDPALLPPHLACTPDPIAASHLNPSIMIMPPAPAMASAAFRAGAGATRAIAAARPALISPPVSPTVQPLPAKAEPVPLALFAATVTCLIWYGTQHPPAVAQRSEREALMLLTQFCQRLLGSTQVTRPVVLLALLYAQRYRRATRVQGMPGCEYRLFTVALMLANKYLDDSTYTAHTWASVSGLPQREIVIMEIEFLQALGHRLHVPDTEYHLWTHKLEQWAARHFSAHQQQPPQLRRALPRASPSPITPPATSPLHGIASTPLHRSPDPLLGAKRSAHQALLPCFDAPKKMRFARAMNPAPSAPASLYPSQPQLATPSQPAAGPMWPPTLINSFLPRLYSLLHTVPIQTPLWQVYDAASGCVEPLRYRM
ncbi:uncharacterized protein VTP21DRAFT_7045 [Calcarisporiella thermophila]|uniref:uncharacterized protein n=1 Tax=Calcarisporiella thermophila TaxID=911321 RepID=UPI0037424AE7